MTRIGKALLAASLLTGWLALALAATGCTAECNFDTDCEGTAVCESGQCVPASTTQLGLGVCETHSDCSPRERCQANRCEPARVGCGSDADCPGDQVCRDHECVDPGAGEGCPSPPPPPPCAGHDAPCPCIAGDYLFLPRAGCSGMQDVAITLLQDECQITIMFANDALRGTISPDGELTLMGDLVRCNATEADDTGFELECEGCVISLIPFLPPLPSVEIPAGPFLMGSDDPNAGEHEGPLHEVDLSCFRMDTVEVTNRHYHECVYQPHDRFAALCGLPTGISSADDLLHPDLADLPVRGVTFSDAERFCALRGKRLPTEAQWEKAARGGADDRSYPWGEDTDGACARDHFDGCVPPQPLPADQTSGTSPYGVKNMAGNVRNWVRDAYSESIYGDRAGDVVEDPAGPSPSGNPSRVIRGGSYLLPVEESQVYRRRFGPAEGQDEELIDVGFRCAR